MDEASQAALTYVRDRPQGSPVRQAADPTGTRSRLSQADLARAVERFMARDTALHLRPRIVVNAERWVLWATPGAEAALREPLPLLIRDGRLEADSPSGKQALTDFFETLCDTPQQKLIRGRRADVWVRLKAWSAIVAGERMLFLDGATSLPLRKVEQSGLAADFGLTRTECIVLDGVARLQKPPQIAQELNISLSTVRSHLKQIHAKMAVNSSLQLLQLTRAYCDN